MVVCLEGVHGIVLKAYPWWCAQKVSMVVVRLHLALRAQIYGMTPNLAELPTMSAGDPSVFEPIRMRVEADRR